MYATRQDIIDIYGSDALTVAADRDGDGQEDAGVVDQALADATELMDSYIGAKYALPLPTPAPDVLRPICVDLAFYRLSQGAHALTEEIEKRETRAIAWLKDVARGVVSLGIDPSPESAGGGVQVVSGDRRFTRGKLTGL